MEFAGWGIFDVISERAFVHEEMQQTVLPISEECRILGGNAHSATTYNQASLSTQDVPPIQDLNREAGIVATALTDKVTLSTICTVVTA
eukprot:6819930-Ditylum_brightwellii.AAC.1